MAININSVYKTVLVVLEQEKRGALLPAEFNKIANQAQKEIFTEYLDDYNQLLRMPQTDLAYADRMALLQEKISLFAQIIPKRKMSPRLRDLNYHNARPPLVDFSILLLSFAFSSFFR